jgi:hypothetical protein
MVTAGGNGAMAKEAFLLGTRPARNKHLGLEGLGPQLLDLLGDVPDAPAGAGASPFSEVALLVGDGGDDYEMDDEFVQTMIRLGDRAAGLAAGLAIAGTAWAIWTFA